MTFPKDYYGEISQWKVIDIAKVCHEVNRAYCVSLGDDSQPPWVSAPEWQKDSCYMGVIFICENLSATPRESHEKWLRDKEAAGWKWGPVKDVEKKEHPCFRPYDELPKEQQTKDALFIAVVKAML